MFLAYIRVSTFEQTMGTSLDDQENIVRGIAMAKGVGKFDVALYKDVDVSGSTPLRDRPDGQRLWADMKKGDVVVASKLDRMFRSVEDALASARQIKAMGVDLVLADMGMDPVTGNGVGRFFFTMLSAFAELERDRIRERMHGGLLAKKERGGYYAGKHAPYGVRVEGKGKFATLVAEPEEQAVINEIMRCHNQGNNLRTIARNLRDMGIKTRSGKNFVNTQIARIIASVKWPKLERDEGLRQFYAERSGTPT
jgi:putative DNA-invertase from lambdoid prophage Rac